MGEGLGEVEFGDIGGEQDGGREDGESGGEIVLKGEGVGEAVLGCGDGGIETEGAAEG